MKAKAAYLRTVVCYDRDAQLQERFDAIDLLLWLYYTLTRNDPVVQADLIFVRAGRMRMSGIF